MTNSQESFWVNKPAVQLSTLALAGIIAVVLTCVFTAVPSPSPDNTPPEQFSSKRAIEYTKVLFDGNERPHPPGSSSNAAIRKKLVEQLRELGLKPEVQTGWAGSDFDPSVCGIAHNVLVRIEGKEKGPAVAISAHYDSMAAGPGVSDDLVNVGAIVEIARLLKLNAPYRNPIMLLITDAEESGLMGATIFGEHPWSKDLAAVVNLEAAGTSGLSQLFETGARNGWIIDLYARHAPQPNTNSLIPVLVELSSHATDFRLHKKRGVDGANFAYSGDPLLYHTPLDDLAHLNEGSLRHQGDNATAIITALANADLNNRSDDRIVYQDIANIMVVSWSESLNLVLVIVLVLLFAGIWVLAHRRGLATVREVFYGMGIFVAAIIIALLTGAIVSYIVAAGAGTPAPWLVIQSTFSFLYTLVAIAGLLVSVMLLGKRAGEWGTWIGVWGGWTFITLCVALVLPPASTFFVIPVAVALVCGIVIVCFKNIQFPPLSLSWFTALIVWFPMISLINNALGYSSGVFAIVFALSPLLPITTRLADNPRIKHLLWSVLALAGIMTIVVILQPHIDKEHPVGANIVTNQNIYEKHSTTRLETMCFAVTVPNPYDLLPKDLKEKFGGSAANYTVKGDIFDAPAPKAILSENNTRLTVQSQRGATNYQVYMSSDITVKAPGDVMIKGAAFDYKGSKLKFYQFYGPEEGPLQLKLESESKKSEAPLLWVGDIKPGIASVAEELAKARGSNTVPIHYGDRSVVGNWINRP